ncbi:MAG TPA: WhiB family transcriptional regulator [Intrasporangium sp.]|jgi:Transcription factor WhiB.|uniref:WhiB family transcriptional regulator n=1 Tax=Intrasporangium sp. TaxID=1925024 RepID=UPI002F91C7DD
MTRNRLHLRTAPRTAERAHPRPLGRDLFDSKAFTAATHHPFELGDVTPPCTAEDPELFWPATESEAALAKAVCRGCPLVRSCLATAEERGEWGVWGGELLSKGRVTTDLPGNVRPSPRDQPRTA